MENDFTYYVVVMPKFEGKFRPFVLDYGLSYEKAERVMRQYVDDHGLHYFEDGKNHEAFCFIKRTKEELPSGYRIKNLKNIKRG